MWAGRFVGGVVRYSALLTLGVVATFTFFCSLVALMVAVGGSSRLVATQDPVTYAFGVIALTVVMSGVSVLRWFSLDLPDWFSGVWSALVQQFVPICLALVSLAVLLFI